MKLTCILAFWLPFLHLGATSSINSIDLPKPPERRVGMKESEQLKPTDLTWYRYYQFYTSGETVVKNGLWIERTRDKDRERYDTDFTEVRRIFYNGTPSVHSVKSVWIEGVLRERVYELSEKLIIKVMYNAQGQEVMGAKAKARGGRAKRERVTRVFNEVYELNE